MRNAHRQFILHSLDTRLAIRSQLPRSSYIHICIQTRVHDLLARSFDCWLDICSLCGTEHKAVNIFIQLRHNESETLEVFLRCRVCWMPVRYWVRTDLFHTIFAFFKCVCFYYNHTTARTIWLGRQGEWEGNGSWGILEGRCGGPGLAAPGLVAARFIQKQVEFMAEIAAH